MFFPESRVRVFVHGQAVDMRKSFDGLAAAGASALGGSATRPAWIVSCAEGSHG